MDNKLESNIISRSDLRRLLGNILISSTDFDRFCCIHFQDVWNNISKGMERGQKEIALFERETEEAIYKKLREYDPDRFVVSLRLIQQKPDARAAALRDKLELLYRRRSDVDQEIQDIKLQLRSGAQLIKGDYLCNGRYSLIQNIGTGLHTTVWHARDHQSERDVAIRALKYDIALDPIRLSSFRSIYRTISGLRYPHIVPILLEPTEEDGINYVATEIFPLGDIDRVLSTGLLSRQEILTGFVGVCEAIEYAHKKSILHLNLKPSNILFNTEKIAFLSDFIVNKPGSRGFAGIDFRFSPPEFIKNRISVGPESDIYSIGMIILYILLGAEIYNESYANPLELLENKRVSKEAYKALHNCVQIDTQKRSGTITELKDFLSNYREHNAIGNSSTIRLALSDGT